MKFDKNQIEKFYNKDYIFNLKNLPFEQVWVSLDELEISPHNTSPWCNCINDPYLMECKTNRINLALDILENGTYWPFVGYPVCNKYCLAEGIHRYESLKIAQKEGLIPLDKKFLMINVPFNIFYRQNSYLNEKLSEPVKMIVPIDLQLMRYYYNLYKIFGERNIDISGQTVEFSPLNKWESWRSYQVFTTYLRDIFYEYKQETGEMVKPSIIINNYDEWFKWYKSEEK